jgi:Leucine-rich repeat (LRR) protein
MPHIKTLHIQYTSLKVLPSKLSVFTSLTDLDIGGNLFNSLGEELGKLTSLKKLSLKNLKKIKTLPTSFTNLCNLENMELSVTKLPRLPEHFSRLSKLNTLFLARNQELQLDDSFAKLNLTSLQLLMNQMPSLPDNFGYLQHLKKLIIGEEFVDGWPSTFTELIVLEDLEVWSMPDISIEEISKLVSLTRLGLQSRTEKDEALPPNFYNLQHLDLTGSPFLAVDCFNITTKTNMKSLVLAQTSPPQPTIEEFINLTTLDLSGCGMTTIPLELCKLINLEELRLKENSLSSFPIEFFNLTNLKHLDMRKNKIEEIPAEFSRLQNLTWLSFVGNKIWRMSYRFDRSKFKWLAPSGKMERTSTHYFRD